MSVIDRKLTELEGAVLLEVALRGRDTAYKVRRAFQLSPSVQWRGSAGAVSPAVRRMIQAGLIETRPHPSRRGQLLALTKRGLEIFVSWATDVELACGVGFDPFRLRAGAWRTLAAKQREHLFAELEAKLTHDMEYFAALPAEDSVHKVQKELAAELRLSRLRWLKRQSPGKPEL